MDTVTGRFISVDPVLDTSNPQQWNAYAYAGNNPVTFSDPSGLIITNPHPDGMTDAQWAQASAGGTPTGLPVQSSSASNPNHKARTVSPQANIPVSSYATGGAGSGGGATAPAGSGYPACADLCGAHVDWGASLKSFGQALWDHRTDIAMTVGAIVVFGVVCPVSVGLGCVAAAGAVGVAGAGSYMDQGESLKDASSSSMMAMLPIGPEAGLGVRSADSLAASALKSDAKGGVYVLRDEADAVVRTGRAKDLDRRATEHARDPRLSSLQFEAVYRTDNYFEQRGLEQMLYDAYPGARAANGGFNRIGAISARNPFRESYLSAPRKYLDGQ